ncbi:DUF559 domain-containing protein [Xanthobacteraceae bacterium Astr-EGSB]|uniref:DUF559 domain-containing protein n=1 Tax=Astrobacterium formosum TaxID=3069710 RepID=UPI0027B6F4F1|nr:DUF559 domain-containing protein [Xanthobacteraceae bacterium Astr-EGSB]
MVEVDGGQHGFDAHAKRDAVRDRNRHKQGFRVLRFWNSDIDRNLDGVLMVVDEALQDPTPGLRPDPPLAGEG